MFKGGYYADILIHELKGKSYNKKWLLAKHFLQMIAFATLTILAIIAYSL